MDKLLIVGPVPPIRGGVSKHTHEIACVMAGNFLVEVISPKLLYPRMLYPGKSQLDESKVEPTHDSVPYSLQRKSWPSLFLELFRVPKNGKTSIIIPWWTWFLSPNILVCKYIANMRRMDVVLFCHNVLPHDVNRFSRRITLFTLRRFSRFIVQSEEEKRLLSSLLPYEALGVAPHPPYFPRKVSKVQKENGKPKTLLFFGMVKNYKGVGKLNELVPHLSEFSWKLQIAGEVWGNSTKRELENLAASNENVELIDRFVSEEEKAALFANADAVLLPYLELTGSGVLADAKGFRVPVIASQNISMGSEYREGIDGLSFQVEPEGSLLKAVIDFSRNQISFRDAWSNIELGDQWRNVASAITKTLAK